MTLLFLTLQLINGLFILCSAHFVLVCISCSSFFFLLSILDSSSPSSSSPRDEPQSPPSFLYSSPIGPAFPLEATPTLSPSHAEFFLHSPASSSSSSSSSSSPYSLLCRAAEPDSPTGCSSSGGSSALVSEGSLCFSVSDSFSAQVKFLFNHI